MPSNWPIIQSFARQILVEAAEARELHAGELFRGFDPPPHGLRCRALIWTSSSGTSVPPRCEME
jgi:hypothetical protein